MVFRQGKSFNNDGLVVLLLIGFFVQSCLTHIFISYGDHMYNRKHFVY
jgi:hypothetical protein